LTAAERQLQEDKDRFNKTVFGGVVTGAIAGAAIGYAACMLSGAGGKKSQNCLWLGLLVGGGLGLVDGYNIAKKQQTGNNEVRAIQSAVRDIQQDNARLEQLITTSDAVLNEGRQRLVSLKTDLANGRMTAQQAEEGRRREERNIALLNDALKKARDTRSQYAQAGQKLSNDPNIRRDLDAEIARTDRQIAQLERNLSEYSRALAVSRA
jgi:hypothetical protein